MSFTDRGDQLALPCPRERGFFGWVFFSFVPSPREIIPGLPRRHEVGGFGVRAAVNYKRARPNGGNGKQEGVLSEHSFTFEDVH